MAQVVNAEIAEDQAHARALRDPTRNAQNFGQQAMANVSLAAALPLAVLVFRLCSQFKPRTP